MELALLGQGKDIDPVRCHSNGMFELRGKRFVTRDRCPVIGKRFGLWPTQVNHRLDRKEHALFEARTRARATIVQNVGGRMKNAAQTVPAKVANDRHPMRFDIGLDRVANIAERVARLDDLDPQHQRIMGHLNQALRLSRQLAGDIHARRITKPTIDDHSDVDVQDVAILQNLVARYPVTNYMVHADAARVLITLVPDRGGLCARLIDHLGDQFIDFARGLARKHVIAHRVEDARGQGARIVHAGEIRGVVDANAVFGETAAGFLIQCSLRWQNRAYM